MKRLFTTMMFMVCCLFCAQTIFADRIPTKGKWGQDDIRSIFPTPPTASIDGAVLSIGIATPLDNLMVQIKDIHGLVVYEECISASSPQSYTIPLNISGGEYTLTFIHQYGVLSGSFRVE